MFSTGRAGRCRFPFSDQAGRRGEQSWLKVFSEAQVFREPQLILSKGPPRG